MGVFTDHPHTAITEKIDKIIGSDLEPDIELPELLNTIKLQYSGAIEAARAIRKKLKYGSPKEQFKSLDLLNSMVLNGGKPLEELYNDRKLLERLKLSATDPEINTKLRKKIIYLAIAWNENFSDKKYYNGIANLKRQIPTKSYRRKKSTTGAGSSNFMNDEAYNSDEEGSGSGAGSSSNLTSGFSRRNAGGSGPVDPNVKYKIPKINLQKESPKIKLLIAESSQASTDLANSLKSVNRSKGETSTDNVRATQYFDKSRIIRRKILHYLQLVDSEEFLGSLIHANEELVEALQLYTSYAREINVDSDDDSLSDYSTGSDLESVTDSLASSMIEEYDRRFPQSTRRAPAPPTKLNRENTAEGNPFGDSNEVDESVEWK